LIPGYREFEFDLPEALLKSIIDAFDSMESAPLSPKDVLVIPDAQGVYQLLLGDDIVYIGKTDSEAGLLRRLSRHAWTIQNREGLTVTDVFFKAVRVYVFTAVDLETQLIKFYRGKYSISWNNSGFGSNDPGRNRDWTAASPGSFDVLYPLDLDQPILFELEGETSLSSVISALKKELPYTLRVQRAPAGSRKIHPDFDNLELTLTPGNTTAREMIVSMMNVLPPGWQATALAGRIIIYKEFVDNYPEGKVIARS
jgi:hypothetical protein